MRFVLCHVCEHGRVAFSIVTLITTSVTDRTLDYFININCFWLRLQLDGTRHVQYVVKGTFTGCLCARVSLFTFRFHNIELKSNLNFWCIGQISLSRAFSFNFLRTHCMYSDFCCRTLFKYRTFRPLKFKFVL